MTPFAALQSLCGLTIHEAAEFLAISQSYAEKIRRGDRPAGPHHLAALAALWSEIETEALLIEAAINSGEPIDESSLRPQAYGLALARIIGRADTNR